MAGAVMAALVASCTSSDVVPTNSRTTSPPTSGRTTGPTTTEAFALQCGVVASSDAVVTSRPAPCGVSTHAGSTIHIILAPGFRWNTPKSDSSAVEVVDVERHSSGMLDVDLFAARVGQATVSTAGAVLCLTGQPCPALARLWEVHVTVGA